MPAPVKKFRLSGMGITEISLCPSGDNPPAEVLIAKAQDDEREVTEKAGTYCPPGKRKKRVMMLKARMARRK